MEESIFQVVQLGDGVGIHMATFLGEMAGVSRVKIYSYIFQWYLYAFQRCFLI